MGCSRGLRKSGSSNWSVNGPAQDSGEKTLIIIQCNVPDYS